jgi:hypothetical protein
MGLSLLDAADRGANSQCLLRGCSEDGDEHIRIQYGTHGAMDLRFWGDFGR